MLELTLCSMLTILPDFLFRRFVQGKRFGKEINLFTVWYELRWGITACLILTISLITTVFYFHPSTNNAISLFRTVPILAERHWPGCRGQCDHGTGSESGNTAVPVGQHPAGGCRSKPPASRSRRSRPAFAVKQTELASADGQIQEARSALQQAMDELETKSELLRRDSGTVSKRDIERLQNVVDGRRGSLDAAIASQAKHRGQPQHAVAGAEGERGSSSCTGAGGARQDDRLCGRRRQGRAIRIAHRRPRQSDQPRPAGMLIPTEAGHARPCSRASARSRRR